MINKRNVAILKSSKGEPVELAFDPRIQDLVVVKIGAEESMIEMKELYQFVFQCVGEEDQIGLIPSRKQEVRKFRKQHMVTTQKDLKAGEQIVVNCDVNIDETVVQGMKNLIS